MTNPITSDAAGAPNVAPVGTRGFGFISREQGDDVFVHDSNIHGDGHRSLAEGDRVEFDTAPGRTGEKAQNVRVI